MKLLKIRWQCFLGIVICGFLLSLASGLVENEQGGSIVELRRYGYPVVWRVTHTLGPTEYRFDGLLVNAVVWMLVSFVGLFFARVLQLKTGFRYSQLLLPSALFVPLGLAMDFVHEFGHTIWGTAVGGRLTYMQIAFFEIYPQLAVTTQFVLGCVQIEGLTTRFSSGVMGIGGSLTTNIVAWLIGVMLHRRHFGYKIRVTLKTFGVFGVLDLPFYVVFPQLGLGHWLFLGGRTPEPLIAARNIGVPDPVFYLMVALTTFGLVLLYVDCVRVKVRTAIRHLLLGRLTKSAEVADDISSLERASRVHCCSRLLGFL